MFALVARELTNRQIATELLLSEHTVATHVRNVLKKLGLRSRTQIAGWFTDHEPLPRAKGVSEFSRGLLIQAL